MGSVPINMSDAVSRRMLITRPTNSGGVVNWIVALATEKKEALPIPTNSIAAADNANHGEVAKTSNEAAKRSGKPIIRRFLRA